MRIRSFYVGDVGNILRGEIRDADDELVDLTGATDLRFRLRKPDGTVLEREAVAGPEVWFIDYAWAGGDLDMRGLWKAQGFADLDGVTLRTNIVAFRVQEPL